MVRLRQRSSSRRGNCSPGRATPTIVQLTSSSRMVCPMIAGVRREPPRPEGVSEHDDVRRARRIVCRREEAPELRLDAEGGEELAGHPRRAHDFGRVRSRSG